MPTFTTVVHHEVTLSNVAYSIDTVARMVETTLLADAPRGAKCRYEHSLIENGNGEKFEMTTIILMNVRGTVIGKALVYGEKPLVPGQRGHANASSGEYIACRYCEQDLFYDVGRSRFYNNHICANCDGEAQTLTETGACT